MTEPVFPACTLVVLGRGLNPDGSLTPASLAAVAKAVALSRSKLYRRVIFSGGYSYRDGPPRNGAREALAMKAAFIMCRGIAENIETEPDSLDSIGNFALIAKGWPWVVRFSDVTVVCAKAQAMRVPFLARRIWDRAVRIETYQPESSWLGRGRQLLKEMASYGLMRWRLHGVTDGNLDAVLARLERRFGNAQ